MVCEKYGGTFQIVMASDTSLVVPPPSFDILNQLFGTCAATLRGSWQKPASFQYQFQEPHTTGEKSHPKAVAITTPTPSKSQATPVASAMTWGSLIAPPITSSTTAVANVAFCFGTRVDIKTPTPAALTFPDFQEVVASWKKTDGKKHGNIWNNLVTLIQWISLNGKIEGTPYI